MDHFGEQPKFEIQPTIEQKPFESRAVQSFFTEWCEINDSIQLQVVDREQWDTRGMQGILEKRPDGKQTLFIPEDLQLWEMVGVMEVVDKDTFAAKPERGTQAKEKMLALGKTFENAGVYIARRLSGIENGREIAEALALEFYQYGQSLSQGKAQEISQIDELASRDLTPQETETVDQFLAGDTLYEQRKQKVEQLVAGNQTEKDALYETQRQKTLAQFFRVAEKAFTLSKPRRESFAHILKKKLNEKIKSISIREKRNQRAKEDAKSQAWKQYQSLLNRTLSVEDEKEKKRLEDIIFTRKPWISTTPTHTAFLNKISSGIIKQIETPKREFEMAIFRRGMELLQRNMPFDKLPDGVKNTYLRWKNGETTLREALKIDELKTQLEQMRQKNDTAQISKLEREIADKIQSAVSSFPYRSNANNPSEMIANQHINCLGASTLGGALMKEAGLNYLVGDVPEHSILFLVTSDGQVELRDMLSASFNERLTDEMIKGQKRDSKPNH